MNETNVRVLTVPMKIKPTLLLFLICAFVLATSKKVRNVRANPSAAVHYAVSEATDWDSLLVQGTASIVDTVEGRRELWDRMGYDLAAFEPGGPESGGHVFLRITPTKAVVLRMYGIKGRETWPG